MSEPIRRDLHDGRRHFQHGPIDCLIRAEGDAAAVASGIEFAWRRFCGVLCELAAELPLLRTNLSSPSGAAVAPNGPVARRMVSACRPHAEGGRFITAMAAVAGSVAEELIASFADEPGITRAWVNNGGDIALHLSPDAQVQVGIVADLARALARHAPEGRFSIGFASPVRGIATSGWRGRSFSLGIADAVTVLARTASEADAAATMIANAVDVDAPGIVRVPANSVRDDSDLGDRLVTRFVPTLAAGDVERALARGVALADNERRRGTICAAVLCLQGRHAVVGDVPALA